MGSALGLYPLVGPLSGYLAFTVGLVLVCRHYYPSLFLIQTTMAERVFVPCGPENPLSSAMNNPPGYFTDRGVSVSKECVGCWFATLSLAVLAAYGAKVMQDTRTHLVPPGFVFVMPLSWSETRKAWTLCAEHQGKPDTLFNVQIDWVDSIPAGTLPVNRVPAIPEIDATANVIDQSRCFLAPASEADHQHFLFTISHRTGNLIENLRIERVKDKWNYAVSVNDSTPREPGEQLPALIECRDKDFPRGVLGYNSQLNPCVPKVIPFH